MCVPALDPVSSAPQNSSCGGGVILASHQRERCGGHNVAQGKPGVLGSTSKMDKLLVGERCLHAGVGWWERETPRSKRSWQARGPGDLPLPCAEAKGAQGPKGSRGAILEAPFCPAARDQAKRHPGE